MTTALRIIQRAFQKATIKAAETPITAAELDDGLDELNDLINAWNAAGILKGVSPVNDANDDLFEPDYATGALKANLATIICGEYDIDVNRGLAISASTYKELMKAASTDLEDIPFPSTLPVGSGNDNQYGCDYNRDFFPENEDNNF